jgi:hypothetical protein
MTPSSNKSIGTLTETSLHASLKTWYALPGDQAEIKVDGYFIDLVRGNQLIEFQTRNFSALRTKLADLLDKHPVHLVYPLVKEKWVVRQSAAGELISRRRSPKHAALIEVFTELIRIPHLLGHPDFTFEVLWIICEDVWQNDGKGSWTRKYWSVIDRRLLSVSERVFFSSLADFTALLPFGWVEPFTNAELAAALRCHKNLARKITYTLLRSGELVKAGKKGNSLVYQRRSVRRNRGSLGIAVENQKPDNPV